YGGKRSAYQDHAVRLHCKNTDVKVCIRIEGRIQRTVRVQAGDMVSRCDAADVSEITSDNDLAIRLQSNRIDTVICIRIKGSIQRAVRVQASDAVPRLSAHGKETAGHDDLAVRLDPKITDCAIRGLVRECGVQRAIRIQARDIDPCYPAYGIDHA